MSLIGKAMLVPTTSTSAETLKNKSISLDNNTLTGTLAQFNTALTNGTFATLEGLSVQWGGPPSYNSATGVFTIPRSLTDLVNNVDPISQLKNGFAILKLESDGVLKLPNYITADTPNKSVFINTINNTTSNVSNNWEFAWETGNLKLPGGGYLGPIYNFSTPWNGIVLGLENLVKKSRLTQDIDTIKISVADNTLSAFADVSVVYTGNENDAYVKVGVKRSGTAKEWYFKDTGALRFPDNTEQTTAWIPGTSLAGYATETFVGGAITAGLTGYATQNYVSEAIGTLVSQAPAALDTLYELSLALGSDPSFATTVTTALGNRLRVDINSQGLNTVQQQNARTNLGLSAVATSGSYTDLSNKPFIENFTDAKARLALSWTAGSGSYDLNTGVLTLPTQTSHLINNSGYITGISPTLTSPTITTPTLSSVVTRKSDNTTDFKVVDEYVKIVSGTATNFGSPLLLDSFNISNYRTVKYLIEVSAVHPQGSTVVELVEVSVAVQAGSGVFGVFINSVTLVHVMDYYMAQFDAHIDDTNTYVTLTATTHANNSSATNFKILATGFRRLTS